MFLATTQYIMMNKTQVFAHTSSRKDIYYTTTLYCDAGWRGDGDVDDEIDDDDAMEGLCSDHFEMKLNKLMCCFASAYDVDAGAVAVTAIIVIHSPHQPAPPSSNFHLFQSKVTPCLEDSLLWTAYRTHTIHYPSICQDLCRVRCNFFSQFCILSICTWCCRWCTF